MYILFGYMDPYILIYPQPYKTLIQPFKKAFKGTLLVPFKGTPLKGTPVNPKL